MTRQEVRTACNEAHAAIRADLQQDTVRRDQAVDALWDIVGFRRSTGWNEETEKVFRLPASTDLISWERRWHAIYAWSNHEGCFQ
jgi:hypothetical protein